jgi:hypothetical protein
MYIRLSCLLLRATKTICKMPSRSEKGLASYKGPLIIVIIFIVPKMQNIRKK